VVRRRARPRGLPDVRHGAISLAAIRREVNDFADALASPIERTKIRVLRSATRRAVPIACDATIGDLLRPRCIPKRSSPKRTEKISLKRSVSLL
jgi:hypothetical protein